MNKQETVSKAATSETAKRKIQPRKLIIPQGEEEHKKNKCWLWSPDNQPAVDHTGVKQGRLTYLYPVGIALIYNRYKEWIWLCQCECGNEKLVRAMSGHISCGCRVYKKKEKKAIERFVKDPDIPVYKAVKFDRGAICIKSGALCKFYTECVDERMETGKVSARYVKYGLCYIV